MASFFLPTFLTRWELPSISAFALSANLQRRILSYLLRRSLGHLVVGGQLDLDQIDAGIGSGKIEIRNVQLDPEAANRLLPSAPLQVSAGSIGRISIQLPVPNFWSGDLVVTVSQIEVKLRPVAVTSDTEESPAATLPSDLAASFASATSQLLEIDDEAQELQQSIHDSLADPHATDQPDVEASSIISSYVEALLARLKVSVKDVSIHMVSEAATLSLTLKEAKVHSTNSKREEHSPSREAGDQVPAQNVPIRTISETIRSLQLEGIQLTMVQHQIRATSSSAESDISSQGSESSFDHDDDNDEDADDLDDHGQSSMSQSTSSLYASAMEESSTATTNEEALARLASPGKPTRLRQERDSSDERASSTAVGADTEAQLLLDTGLEPIKIIMTTTKLREPASSRLQSISSAQPRRPALRLCRIDTAVHVEIGNVAMMIFVDDQLPTLIALSSVLASSYGHKSSASHGARPSPQACPTPAGRPTVAAALEVTCTVRGLHLILGYDRTNETNESSADEAFWARPAKFHPNCGHLRVRGDLLQAKYTKSLPDTSSNSRSARTPSASRDPSSVSVSISDIGIFEHLSPALAKHLPAEAPSVVPILLFDQNLVHPSDAAATHGRAAPGFSRQAPHSAPSVDTMDWRSGLRVSHGHKTAAASNVKDPEQIRAARFHIADMRSLSSGPNLNPYFRASYGERGWKMKPRHRTHSSSMHSSADLASAKPAAVMTMEQRQHVQQTQFSLDLAPVHVFVDVSLCTRLLPSLKRAAADLASRRSTSADPCDLADSTVTLSASTATLQQTPPHELLSDLGNDTDSQRRDTSVSFGLRSDLVRIEIRVPQVSFSGADLAGHDLRTVRLLGLARRSGLLLLDVKNLDLRLGCSETETKARGVHFAEAASFHERLEASGAVTGRASAEKIAAYLTLSSDQKAVQIAIAESMRDDDISEGIFTSSSSTTRLTPRLVIAKPRPDAINSTAVDPAEMSPSDPLHEQYSCLVPSVSLELGKMHVDLLQYMADDLTQWLTLWSSESLDDSDELDSEGLRILGSRFFGSRAGLSVLSASTESTSTARNTGKRSAFAVGITEISVTLQLPELSTQSTSLDEGLDATTAGAKSAEALASSVSLLLVASDTQLLFESDKARSTSQIEARISTFKLSRQDTSAAVALVAIVSRTMDISLSRTERPMLTLVVEAYSEPGSSYREQSLDLVLSSTTFFPPLDDDDLLAQVKHLFKAPEGVFENVEPNEVTRISFKARECSLLVAPPGTEHRAALALREASVKTKLTSHAPRTSIKLALADVSLFALDRPSETDSQGYRRGPKTLAEHWLLLGFCRVLYLSEAKGSINLNTLTRPELDIKVHKLRAKMQACADTLDVVAGLVSALSSLNGSSATTEHADEPAPRISSGQENSSRSLQGDRSRSPSMSSSTSADSARLAQLMASIDDEAFRRAAPMASTADLVDDDVPHNPDFLGAKAVMGRYHPELVETALEADEFFGGDSVASLSVAPPAPDNVVFADEDVTIRVLDPRGVCPADDYFTDPDLKPRSDSLLGSTASSVRIRISNSDFSLRLHAGYDWPSTQRAVEDEAKRVRRRLQKIKQLLAEGQTPDDSIDAAVSDLFDSVHISLPHNPAEMDPADILRAMDDELGDAASDVASTVTSGATSAKAWQTLASVPLDQGAKGAAGGSTSGGGSGAGSRGKLSKLQRSAKSVIEFSFRGIAVEFDQLDASEPTNLASRIAVDVRRFEILDNVKTSTWRTFLTEMKDRESAYRREEESKMIKIELLNVRAETSHGSDDPGSAGGSADEVRVRARLAPLRLHVDQDALDFLKKFFAFQAPGKKAAEGTAGKPPKEDEAQAVLPFIQYAEVLPVKLKLDYKPKRVDYGLLRQGKTIELMNFFHFEAAEMVLRHITLRGINGWPRLFDTLNDIWTPDVKANQLADVLSGVAPIRSLVNVGAGLADLVLLPVEQYNKDGRLLRGFQKGASSFAKSTALEAVKLGARLATGTQVILEQAEHILGGQMPEPITASAVGPDSHNAAGTSGSGDNYSYSSLSESIMLSDSSMLASHYGVTPAQDEDDRTGQRGGTDAEEALLSRYAQQPENMRDALSQAYSGLSRGLTSAAQTILAIPMEVYEPLSNPSYPGSGNETARSGVSAGRPVVRAVPIAILRGARGATEAIAKTMQGVQATLGDMDAAKEGKYKQAGPHRRLP
ncbi:hypothetical protein BCV70DRAFT_197398 [Testicularia cyperi]|uniref:Autophagy-related protein 2 n=1 Tax=Testicularia cyperi TaxID=1882483 RepID=A0A317Y0T4_9BASI|nr:hypothetical protein BCV70DRAFT_197398 [Testicularia cyperi]